MDTLHNIMCELIANTCHLFAEISMAFLVRADGLRTTKALEYQSVCGLFRSKTSGCMAWLWCW